MKRLGLRALSLSAGINADAGQKLCTTTTPPCLIDDVRAAICF